MYTVTPSPLGDIVLTSSDGALTGLYLPGHPDYEEVRKGVENPEPFREAVAQLKEYFEGRRTVFDLPLAPEGTEFQKRVWKALQGIPFGETTTYGGLAKSLNDPNASRAVGLANGKNPIGIIVPCHRVVGASGKLTGYAGGLRAKEWLLNHEGASSRRLHNLG